MLAQHGISNVLASVVVVCSGDVRCAFSELQMRKWSELLASGTDFALHTEGSLREYVLPFIRIMDAWHVKFVPGENCQRLRDLFSQAIGQYAV